MPRDWTEAEVGSCCDGFDPRITGSQRESESEVAVYSRCQSCETLWRDVFTFNRTEHEVTPDE